MFFFFFLFPDVSYKLTHFFAIIDGLCLSYGESAREGQACAECEHYRGASRTMRYVRARSGSGLSSGVAESVRNDDVSGVSKAAARAKYEAATMPDTCMEGIQTCDSATRSSLSMPSAGSPF